MKTFIYVLITNFVFAETDETVVKANVCVNVAFIPPGRCPRLKTYRQGTYEALCEKQVQGRESVSHDGDAVYPGRINVESVTATNGVRRQTCGRRVTHSQNV